MGRVGSKTPQQEQWPALKQLRLLGCTEAPPGSRCTVLASSLKLGGFWSASPCYGVITRDRYFHCFKIAKLKSDKVNTKDKKAKDATTSMPEVEPQWSMFVPNTSMTPVAGKDKWFEVEESRTGLFGIRKVRRESFQAESREVVQQWLAAFAEVKVIKPHILPYKLQAGASAVALAREPEMMDTVPEPGAFVNGDESNSPASSPRSAPMIAPAPGQSPRVVSPDPQSTRSTSASSDLQPRQQQQQHQEDEDEPTSLSYPAQSVSSISPSVTCIEDPRSSFSHSLEAGGQKDPASQGHDQQVSAESVFG